MSNKRPKHRMRGREHDRWIPDLVPGRKRRLPLVRKRKPRRSA